MLSRPSSSAEPLSLHLTKDALSSIMSSLQEGNEVRLTVEDSAGKKHLLLIIFYTPSVFRLRFDPFSDKPYEDSTGAGVAPLAIVARAPLAVGHPGLSHRHHVRESCAVCRWSQRGSFPPSDLSDQACQTPSGFSYGVVDDSKDAQGKPEHSYALVKEKPDRLDIKVRPGCSCAVTLNACSACPKAACSKRGWESRTQKVQRAQ